MLLRNYCFMQEVKKCGKNTKSQKVFGIHEKGNVQIDKKIN